MQQHYCDARVAAAVYPAAAHPLRRLLMPFLNFPLPPPTAGQEFSGYRAQLEACIKRVEDSLPELYELAIGVRLMSPFSPASRLFSPLLPT